MQFSPVGCAGLPGNKIAFTLSQADAMSTSKEERMISDSPVSVTNFKVFYPLGLIGLWKVYIYFGIEPGFHHGIKICIQP